LNVDKHGLDEMDNRILETIIDKFRGGPVGLNTIATAVGEDAVHRGSIEPFLIQVRLPHAYTPRAGSDPKSYTHLGACMAMASNQPVLDMNLAVQAFQQETKT
jgi:Holliday junction DNA helicase RuvB